MSALLLLLFILHSVFEQYEMSSPAAGDLVTNVLHRHRAAIQIQRWFRLLVRQRHNHQISTSEQSVRRMLDSKRQELLRQRTVSSSASDNSDEKDYQRQKEDKARLGRQRAIQVSFTITVLTFCLYRKLHVHIGAHLCSLIFIFARQWRCCLDVFPSLL